MKKKRVIGIAGFIGSGKTTAGKYLRRLGADYIEADKVVESLYMPGGAGWSKIVSFLGERFLKKDKTIDRKKLAKFVFENPNKTKIINGLIHPLVANEIRKIIDKSRADTVVIEAVYFEKKSLLGIVDDIVWIECKKNAAKKRVLKIAKFDGAMFERIYRSQRKPSRIDFVVSNDGSKTDLYKQLKMLYYPHEQ